MKHKYFSILSALLLVVLSTASLSAQDSIKTIPGVFVGENWDPDWKVLQVSKDGQEIAFQQYRDYHILLLKEAKFVSWKSTFPGRLSPDHSFIYTNMPGDEGSNSSHNKHSFAPEPDPKTYASMITSTASDKIVKVFRDTNYIVGINDEDQLLVSTALSSNGKFNGRLRGLVGLRSVDQKTFKVQKVLRLDTLFYDDREEKYMSFMPRMWFNSNSTAFLKTASNVSGKIMVYPFGSDSVITVDCETSPRRHAMVDEHYAYEVVRDVLSVFSTHTGKLLYTAKFPTALKNTPYRYNRCLYAQNGNGRLMRFDREKSIVYDEEVTPAGLKTIAEYPIKIDPVNRLVVDHWYDMAVAAGPSLVIIPRERVDGIDPRNRGYVIDVTGGKISLVIAPFFNPPAAQLAAEQRVAAENRAYYAQQQKQKLSDCLKQTTGLGLSVGNTVYSSYAEGILREYDCAKDVYRVVLVRAKGSTAAVEVKELTGFSFRADWKRSPRQYRVCDNCSGKGNVQKAVEKSRTKEVPHGYFSGVETKVTRTWTDIETFTCTPCNGEGVVR